MSYETYEHESDYDSTKVEMNSAAKSKIMQMRGKIVLPNI